MYEKADTQLIKLINELQVLNLIRDHGPVSKINVARKTKMSKVAVFDIINRLMENGFVIEVGKGDSTARGGKRPSMIKLNPGNHYVVGVEFKRSEARIGLADIEATIIDKRKVSYEPWSDPQQTLKKILQRIDHMLEAHAVGNSKLVSIGIGIPGLIDYKQGVIRFADTLPQWDKIKIVDIFEKHFQVPIIIENDVNTIAIGESFLGAARDLHNFVCIWIGEGIGAGLIIDNQLYKGWNGGAGEVGYLELADHLSPVNLNYFPEDRRYFGEILSLNLLRQVALKQVIQAGFEEDEQASLKKLLKPNAVYVESIQPVLDEYAWLLSKICLIIVKLINPDAIVLSGKVVEYSDYVLERVRQIVKEKTMEIPFTGSTVIAGKLGEEAGLMGAMALALQVIFETGMANAVRANNH